MKVLFSKLLSASAIVALPLLSVVQALDSLTEPNFKLTSQTDTERGASFQKRRGLSELRELDSYLSEEAKKPARKFRRKKRDKARSCLGSEGNRVVRDFATDKTDCKYKSDIFGRFFSRCDITFAHGDEVEVPGANSSTAVCDNRVIKRDCTSDETQTWFKDGAFLALEDPETNPPNVTFCEVAPNYHQLLTPVPSVKSDSSTRRLEQGERGLYHHEEVDMCRCRESFSTPPLKKNCGVIKPFKGGDDGRPGCAAKMCEKVVCALDPFCCGNLDVGNETNPDFIGWWDRFCISYAGQQKECLKKKHDYYYY